MSVSIHPTAVIDAGAALGEQVTIGPYCVVGRDAVLGDRVTLHSHVVVNGRTSLGADSEVFPFAVLGAPPQHTRFQGEESPVVLAVEMPEEQNAKVRPDVGATSLLMVKEGEAYLAYVARIYQNCDKGELSIDLKNADRLEYLHKLGMAYIDQDIDPEFVTVVSAKSYPTP